MTEPERPAKPSGNTMRLAGLGMELAAAVGGACLLGYWIDRHFETSPWGLLICAVVGVVGGLYNLIRQAVREMVLGGGQARGRREDDRHAGDDGTSP